LNPREEGFSPATKRYPQFMGHPSSARLLDYQVINFIINITMTGSCHDSPLTSSAAEGEREEYMIIC